MMYFKGKKIHAMNFNKIGVILYFLKVVAVVLYIWVACIYELESM